MADYAFENIGWTVGNHCNATCGHCYSWKVRKDSREFLTEADVDRVVEQLVRLGIKTVNVGGNEPIYTHGPDIRQSILPYIIRALTEASIPVGLTTNGMTFWYLDKHHRDELLMVNDIDFSLDSPFAAEHDLNRGARLFHLVVRCIRRSLELGIDCSVITCGMRQNFNKEYLSTFLALTQLLGSEFRINTLKPVEPTLIDEMPTPEQFYEGFAFLMSNSHCVTLGESCLVSFTEAGTEGCPCGTSSFRINAKTKDGRIPINPCVYAHEYKAGDLLTDDIFDVIESPQFKAFGDRRRHIPQVCRDSGCEFVERCRGGCASRAYLVNGTLNAKDPYCPSDYLAKNGSVRPGLPHKPDIGCHDGIRVHDNYLCTWIGEVDPDFSDTRYVSLDQFTGGAVGSEEPIHLSGHAQAAGESRSSLVSVKLGRKPAPAPGRAAGAPADGSPG
ncbi:MAG TPA: radical SAM protein [Acidimicrobiales bacterium]|nr:radical SAM protein [Acidimicrobiales bacterium]